MQTPIDALEIAVDEWELVVATNVSETEYMERYAAHFCEWIDGTVIRVTPATLFHNNLGKYVANLLDAYFELRPIGRVITAPFVYKMPELKRNREPDMMVILDGNPGELTDTYFEGAADICIEIISKESTKRDRGDKFTEYELAGVREYWLFDSVRKQSSFFRRVGDSFIQQFEDADGNYITPLLPDLQIHAPTFWDILPGPRAIVLAIEEMLSIK